MSTSVKKKVFLLVNLVAPARIPVYTRLAERCDLSILHGKMEGNRSWKELKVEGAEDGRVWGFHLTLDRRANGRVFDKWFLHIEPGYLFELFRRKPEAVITVEMGFRTLTALVYGSLFGKPVWVWWGGTLHTERSIGGLRKIVRKLFGKWARHWISYGDTSTEYLQSLGIPRDRILQIQNCVDESMYQQRVAQAFELSPKPVLLHVGQLIARKGIVAFLRAASRVQEEGYHFSILLVGGGPDRQQLQQLVSDVGLRNVHFEPPFPPEVMPSVYQSADVLIFPTLEDVWGLVANEGILSGLPVLCSKFAGCASELFDAESIFDPTDDEQFVAGLRRAVTGNLPPSNRSRLKRSLEVGDMIADAVLASIGPQDRSRNNANGEQSDCAGEGRHQPAKSASSQGG